MERGPGRTGGIGVVREAEERTVGDSLKKEESGKKRDGGNYYRKKLNISKSKMGEREEATKKKRGSREFKPREAGGFDSSVPNKMWLLKDVTASYLPTSS